MVLSEEREAELKLHLQTKIHVKMLPQQLKKIIKGVNRVRSKEIKLCDPFPGFEDATWSDWIEVFDLHDWLVL